MIDFTLAKTKHAMWGLQLSTYIGSDNATPPASCLTSYRQCKLGTWLYSDGLSSYGHFPKMRDLERVHRQLHEMAQEIVTLKQHNQVAAAQQKLIEMQTVSNEILHLLDRVNQKFSELR
ncbi:CZB domain-containing protein [Spirulina major]|uniref:CZB domain-containing protein n=1 Tax=Spirulina major TaxID=270636 RepID=UPI000A053FA7|nr:CZB domain-containing protein [Spirulina major]